MPTRSTRTQRKKKRVEYNWISKKLKIPTPPKSKKQKRGQRVYELDTVFSWYVRLFYSGEKGACECYTCGKKALRTQLQNGHHWSRQYLVYRWDIKNCRVQCYACNVLKSGNYIIYTPKMIKEQGRERYNESEKEIKKLKKISIQDLEDMIVFYEKEVLKLAKEKKISISNILK